MAWRWKRSEPRTRTDPVTVILPEPLVGEVRVMLVAERGAGLAVAAAEITAETLTRLVSDPALADAASPAP